jgi:predicted PurR-regulated permease PerM
MTEVRREPLHTTAAGVVDDAQAQVRRVTEGLSEFDRRLRNFVQAQPLTALLGAVVAGYVVARVVRRI